MSRVVSEPELRETGRTLGAELEPGEVVWLEGGLGAGKTTLVQAIAEGLGVTTGATSPTYNLVHRYDARRGPVYHVDCYRLRRPDEAAALDWETLAGADVLLVEWPERAGEWAPPPSRRIRLAHTGDAGRRRLEMSG